MEFNRSMRTILGSSDCVRIIIFPKTTRTVRQESFYGAESLRAAVLNEGLETLGTDEYKENGDEFFGVFQESGLRRVQFP